MTLIWGNDSNYNIYKQMPIFYTYLKEILKPIIILLEINLIV